MKFKTKSRLLEERFHLGLDWIVREDGRPFLLEYQLQPGGIELFVPTGELGHFLQFGASKRHQHELLGDLMPIYTADPGQFDSFRKEHSRVVYKLENGSEGNDVHIFDPPGWHPDLIEEFIQPRTVTRDSQHYAYVIRDCFLLHVGKGWKKNTITAKRTKLIRKLAKSPVGDDSQKAYNLTISRRFEEGTAQPDSVPDHEQKLIDEASHHALSTLFQISERYDWNPLRAFSRAMICYLPMQLPSGPFGYFPGQSVPPALAEAFPEKQYLPNLAEALRAQGIESHIAFNFGLISNAARFAAKTDALIVHNLFSEKDLHRRYHYEVLREQGSIVIDPEYGKRWTALENPPENLFIEGEISPEELANTMARLYLERKANEKISQEQPTSRSPSPGRA